MCDFLWCCCASMERTIKQHYAVKSETSELIKQAYGDDALSRTRRIGNFTAPQQDYCVAAAGEIQHGNDALPPYNPDLAPPDLFLFPQMKRELKGHWFNSIVVVQAPTTMALNRLPAGF